MEMKKNQTVVITWIERYRQTIALLCGGILPPLDICEAWLADGSESYALQDWVCSNMAAPWAQAIIILDAAALMANEPEEGAGHLDKHGKPMGDYK